MYRTQKTLIASLLLTTTAFYAQAQTPCTYQVPTTATNIQVPSGATWCVTANMSANVDIASGGTLRIAQGVTFNLYSMNNFNGTIENYGTLTTGGINSGSGATIRNAGTTTVNSGLNANSGIQLINETNGTFNLNGGANLNGGSALTNSGSININGSLNMNGTVTITNNTDATINFSNGTNLSGNGSTLTNKGIINFNSGDFNTHSGTTLNNSGKLTVFGGNFNPSGAVTNKGWFDARHFININSGAVIVNKCRFVAREGFNNNANFTNEGLVWVSNAGNPKITINGGATFTNSADGKVRGADFDNNGTVVGSGEFYFTGLTRQQGSFNGNNSSNPIKFFGTNTTPNSNYPGSYFNVGIQGNNVTRPASLVPADTTSFYTFCGEQTFTTGGTPLPVTLTSFSAYAENCAVILRWATTEETKFDHFEIEGSSNATQFKTLALVAGQGAKGGNYSYTLAQTSDVRYYRLKMTDLGNKVTYSKTQNVTSTCTGMETSWSVYPNPTSQNNMIQVSNISLTEGQVVVTNLLGVAVKTVPLAVARQGFQMTGVSAGTYLISVYSQDGKRLAGAQKLVVR